MAEHPWTPDEPPVEAPALDAKQVRKAERSEKLAADEIWEVVRRQGEAELQRPTAALGWSGLAAGLSMGFSLVAEGLLRAHLPDAPWRPLVTKLGYSVGFLIVILGSQQLFTENTLTPIVPLLARRNRSILADVARLWGTVLAANLAGAILFAAAVGLTHAFSAEVRDAFLALGREATAGSFGSTFLRAIFAGWLIALMVWMLPGAGAARFWVIVLMTYLVGLGRLAHIIAGSVEAAYVTVTGHAGWGEFFGGFVVPTLLGNVTGGVTMVAALNHAQVVAGTGERR